MKFMKLGSKLDTFYTAAAVRSVSSEISSDLVVEVKGCRYLLHKFPLLSKSARLQRLCAEPADRSLQPLAVQLPDFPGGPEVFELCAKFCYGMKITVSAHNIVAARCAAEYLQMTENIERGNLVQKLDAFFDACVLTGWRDAIVALQSTKDLATWSEELGITSRCCSAVSAKILANPSKVKAPGSSERKSWWAEDLSALSMDLYRRVLISVKSSGEVPSSLIGEALKVYASKWLPGESKRLNWRQGSKQILILESIIGLLPSERGSISASFLCKLLKAANMLSASPSSKAELAQRIRAQLEEASVSDLLIPCPPQEGTNTLYDVDLVLTIFKLFMLAAQSPPRTPDGYDRRKSRAAEKVNVEFQENNRSASSPASHSSKLKIAKLVDGYLQEIAKDSKLPLAKFLAVAESVSESARPDHDGLYKAVDTYLEAHPELGKSERKRLCSVLDCRRLSMEACTHAAGNEKLPLRVVVQVLFVEHSRTVSSGNHNGSQHAHLPEDTVTVLAAPSTPSCPPEDRCSRTGIKCARTSQLDEAGGKPEGDEAAADWVLGKSCMLKNLCVIPARPRKMLSRLWRVNSRVANERSQ
uniref:NPH3 domain-containing protein n=1 Tax=Kalanchoe fedtschenkoi TaxID=63787 RepID=A0A7N0VEJ9_KALFE